MRHSLMLQLLYDALSTRSLSSPLYPPLSASPVCLAQSSGQCMAQLFSRWCVMIRELLEAITLLKCSTAVSSWSTMLKCPQRTLDQHAVSWNRLLQMQPLNLSSCLSKRAAARLLFVFLSCFLERGTEPTFSKSHLHGECLLKYSCISSFHTLPEG